MKRRATILGGLALLSFGLQTASQAKTDDNASKRVWLHAHNAARAEFGVSPLQWNPQLASEAQDWAEKLARQGRMRHSSVNDRRGRGENLWMGTAGYFRADQMIEYFVAEKQHFRPGTFPRISRTGNWSDVGHYTQIVWPETREVGCATARGSHFEVLVCRYWPAGNVSGTYIAAQNKSSEP